MFFVCNTTDMATTVKKADGMSDDTKTIITILLLLFATPVGIILMWVWTKWATWIKVVVTVVPVVFFAIIMFFVLAVLALIVPAVQKTGNVEYRIETVPSVSPMPSEVVPSVSVTPDESY